MLTLVDVFVNDPDANFGHNVERAVPRGTYVKCPSITGTEAVKIMDPKYGIWDELLNISEGCCFISNHITRSCVLLSRAPKSKPRPGCASSCCKKHFL